VINKFEILGLSQVLGRFDEIEREVRKSAGVAVQETILEVAYDAKRDAAKDLGSLVQSIGQEYESSKLEGTVFANAKHAPYIEFGTGGLVEIPEGFTEMAAQFRGKGKRTVNLPARPFLIPAANKGAKSLELKLSLLIR
jgi:hypothetical protein